MSTIGERIRRRREELSLSQDELARRLGYKSRSSINKIELGHHNLTQTKIKAIADALLTTPSYIMGWDNESNFPAPNITDDYVTFPVIGGIAAGYNHIADESWSGETIDIPSKYLRGISRENFFVLRVKGNSMYPLYHDGDMVLIRKQSTLNRSGEIGAILYDDECATLKKVEYVTGENWLVLLPINPDYPPERIEGERLEHCRVIGVPFLLVREILQ